MFVSNVHLDHILRVALVTYTISTISCLTFQLLEINVQNGTKREIPLMRSPYPREIPEPAAGIHAIALNPSKSFMATGGHNVNDLALYSLPDYQPYAVGEFHHNWLFGISWINDFMLCTG